MCDEITYLIHNFNGAASEFWEWISYFITHFVWKVITYPCGYQSQAMQIKRASGKKVS